MKKILLVAACAALVLACAGCAGNQPESSFGTFSESAESIIASNDASEAEIPAESETEESQDDIQAAALDVNNPIVLLFDEQGEDDLGHAYHWQVPGFNCDTEDAQAINQRIKDQFSELFALDRDIMENGASVCCENVVHQTYQAGPYFSLVIRSEYQDDAVYHRVYTIDIATGEAVSNEELLEAAGIAPEEFIDHARQSALACFEGKYGENAKGDKPFAESARNAIVSERNINKDMKMFMDGDQLMLISYISSFVGVGENEEVYPYIKQ